MRQFDVKNLTETVKNTVIRACRELPYDVKNALYSCLENETNDLGRYTLKQLIQNFTIAEDKRIPMCQDTGMVWVKLSVGLDVHFSDDPIEAINLGVKQGYETGLLRKSVVRDPLERVNTGDNTPAIVVINLVPGKNVDLDIMVKGFGSENMSRLKMLSPADGLEGIEAFVLETVSQAGPNACPPVTVGVGIGGTFDSVALAAKEALLRTIGSQHDNPFYANLEISLLDKINKLDIGPQGYGGNTTAFQVFIEARPTHIGAMPVAVNLNCHMNRHWRISL